ncbi:hypothetical protein [Branchiibius sp. NY16-3462-2]|uniref:hypothetical protein n=1 Tax=Branchiibius sp. NY16-3462-2 TaxID=1807500 RepID=UPI00079BE5A1|nr:hypothetical protein [Branchiibius sp. NY16-3462-2]KYH45599.1 hypothetical protein AZH51_17920 [Branchiibius sp. NY16-3462-2]
MKRSSARLSAVTTLLAALTLTGCTGSDPKQTSSPAPPTSSSATGSATPGAGATMPPDMLNFQNKSIAQATSSTFLKNGKQATVFISSVRTGAKSTVLTFWFTAPQGGDSPLAPNLSTTWPTLVDTAGKKAYIVTMFSAYRFGSRTPECVCTPPSTVSPQPRVMTAAYPALPANLTDITVRLKGFTDLKVPITR